MWGLYAFNDLRLSNMTCSGQFVARNDINMGVPRTPLHEISFGLIHFENKNKYNPRQHTRILYSITSNGYKR